MAQPMAAASATPATPPITLDQPAAPSAWAMMPQRKRTVSAPSRKTPVKAMSPTTHSRLLARASSMRCWTCPFMSRACCCIHHACHVSSPTAAKMTTTVMMSGPRSSRGPERKVTAMPMATLSSRPTVPPHVTNRKPSRAPTFSR